jgi:hypothetical protein
MRASAFNGEPEGDPGELYSVGTRHGRRECELAIHRAAGHAAHVLHSPGR